MYILIALQQVPAGVITVRNAAADFRFLESYTRSEDRRVLGLGFEEKLEGTWHGRNRLPAWFSNLLPEGLLRDSVAARLSLPDRNDTDVMTEARMLVALGEDLPGAVTAIEIDETTARAYRLGRESERLPTLDSRSTGDRQHHSGFSVAGVQLKFSLRKHGERFTVPLSDDVGDWIVKMPDARYPLLPRNEFAMMSLAKEAGIEVPPIRLLAKSDLPGLPEKAWVGQDEAFAIKRFDREGSQRLHMEDLQQVRLRYPEQKYEGHFEAAAAFTYRKRDVASLRQFLRRLTLSMCIANDDAHFKNWTLLYPDGRRPILAPAYDIVTVAPYDGLDRSTGLKIGGTRAYERLSLFLFERLIERIDAPARLIDEVQETVQAVEAHLPKALEMMDSDSFADAVQSHFEAVARRLRR